MMMSDSSKIIINNAMNWYEIITKEEKHTYQYHGERDVNYNGRELHFPSSTREEFQDQHSSMVLALQHPLFVAKCSC